MSGGYLFRAAPRGGLLLLRRRLRVARLGALGLALHLGPTVVLAGEPARGPSTPWSGAYLGGGIAAAWGTSNWSTQGPAGEAASGRFDLFKPYDAFAGTGSHYLYLQAGRDVRLPSGIVMGVVSDLRAPSLIGDQARVASPAGGNATLEEQVKFSGTVRGRVGVVHQGGLLYGTGGFAWSHDQLSRTQTAGTPVVGGVGPGDTETARIWRAGWVVGAGFETPVARNWTAQFEYLFTSFNATTVSFPSAQQSLTTDLNQHSLRMGLNYRYDAGATSILPKAPDARDWSVHAQTTYVHQYAFPFRSPYTGTNSFIPSQARQTWDVTFYAGVRPWKGAEIWVNPEIDQGFGLSNTLGIAGFVSGEAYKLGAAEPYARIPRAFLRQTFNIDGTEEKVERGPNQLPGSVRSNRVVLTVGKFGVTDIFDANKFAHDPRSDFLNWSLVDSGSFDYAADAWGFTYGAALEWYVRNWTFRGGLFDLPTVPNSTVLDPTFGQVQWIGEIERRHELWGKPGKVAVTTFLTRSRMGRFEDATAIAQASGQAANIAAVRDYRSRSGVSVNLEQQVTSDVGIFLRAGIADGRTESFAFTDIDRSLAGGVVVTGKSWGRPDDTIGIGGVLNDISKERKAFLNAGGLGILVGDGQLPRPAGEQIIETYYSLPVASWRLTLDYQYIGNPGYNTDRGPVSVVGTRIRKQF